MPETASGDASAQLGIASDRERRFGSLSRLYGEPAQNRLAAAHVCVVGVGGVGSWSAEALARSGVGRLTLIDLDHIAESNINRQVHALNATLGASKIEVMRDRIAQISPDCVVTTVDDFVTADNAGQLIPGDAWLIDAIDQPRAKAAMIALARGRDQPVVVCGAAGARTDPLALTRDDLALTRGDALLASVRARLRREHGFPREAGRRFGVVALYSREVPGAAPPAACAPGAPLACAGYGSAVTVTGTMGFAAAAWVIDAIVRQAS
jgi:tRNA A37 threonylcarbamoyladenosine dehydratase